MKNKFLYDIISLRPTCNGLPVLGIESLVDFVEQVKRGRVALLNGEYQGQGDQRLLTSAQLLHVLHLCIGSSEGHLDGKKVNKLIKEPINR